MEGSGSIEVKDLALAIQAAQPGIDDEKVAAMLSLIDEDGDGTVRPRDRTPPPRPPPILQYPRPFPWLQVTLQEFVMLMLFQVAPAKVPA